MVKLLTILLDLKALHEEKIKLFREDGKIIVVVTLFYPLVEKLVYQ